MRRLPLLLALVVGVALWAAPSSAQVTGEWWPRYVENGLLPGEGVEAFDNGYELCPPHADYCSGYSQAHHHIPPNSDGTATYFTHVLDTHNCSFIVVMAKEADNDTTLALFFIQSVSNDDAANPVVILADVNGDGVINATDLEPMNGEAGDADTDGDGTVRQTAYMYDITGINKMRLSITQTGGAVAELATDSSYAEVSCR